MYRLHRETFYLAWTSSTSIPSAFTDSAQEPAPAEGYLSHRGPSSRRFTRLSCRSLLTSQMELAPGEEIAQENTGAEKRLNWSLFAHDAQLLDANLQPRSSSTDPRTRPTK